MKKLIIFGPGDWAEVHIARLIAGGILKEEEVVRAESDICKAVNHLTRGRLQLIVFAATPTGTWISEQVSSLWQRTGEFNPFAVVSFAPPRLSDLSEEDIRSKLWRILDPLQSERGEPDSLYEIACSVFGDD